VDLKFDPAGFENRSMRIRFWTRVGLKNMIRRNYPPDIRTQWLRKGFRDRPSDGDAQRQFVNQKGKTMKALALKKPDLKKAGSSLAVAAAAVAGMSILGVDAAMAGTDTTFDTALTQFTNFLEGSGGKIITVLSLAGGIVALASGRFSLGQVAIPVGVGVGAGTGVPIVTSTITGTV
jgi:hypothetical protein